MPNATTPGPARQLWQKTCRVLLDSLYPRLCCHCETSLPAHAPSRGLAAWFCATCQDALFPVEAPYCSLCGDPYEGAMTQEFRCSNCEGRRLHLDFAVSGYKVEGTLREVIHQYKYGRHLSLRAPLADMLANTLNDPRLSSEDLSRWLLVPVPLHFSRQVWRGFNQSWELCRQLSRHTGIPAAQPLRRQMRTLPQAHLRRHQRLKNLKGAFGLRSPWFWHGKPDLQGRRILLVDDVLTTGATANECAKVLKQQAGAEKVVVITAARG